jgi:hypothetical protein
LMHAITIIAGAMTKTEIQNHHSLTVASMIQFTYHKSECEANLARAGISHLMLPSRLSGPFRA